MNPIYRLLGKNTSPGRIAGFVLSNFIGLAIVIGAIFFYEDAGSLFTDEDSFVKKDFLVVNKKVGGGDVWDSSASSFSRDEIEDIKDQPWVRKVGEFSSSDYRVWAQVNSGNRGMSTMLFFESVPDDFVDGVSGEWDFEAGDKTVPIIISKDYLALYNFGFAGSAGLPKISEGLMSGIPLSLTLSSEDGTRTGRFDARIVGFSSRLNTILVPQSFIDWSNAAYGDESKSPAPSRLIIEVSSPGDVAISEYLSEHNLEVAGDKTSSSASYLLKVITGIVFGVGIVITILSFFILLLSISLLMEKNREKIHSLLMLGYPLHTVALPYISLVTISSLLAYGLATLCCLLIRKGYVVSLTGLGATPGNVWVGIMVGAIITFVVILINGLSIWRRTLRSWSL